LEEIAVDNLIHFGAGRDLSAAMTQASENVADLGAGEVAEGLTRLVVSEAAQERSQELAEAGETLVAEGITEMAAAEILRDEAMKMAREGIEDVSEGSVKYGEAEASTKAAAPKKSASTK